MSFRCGQCGATMMRGSYRAAPEAEAVGAHASAGGLPPMAIPATGTPLDNPYASPMAAARTRAPAATQDAIASRSSRLAAVLIDYVCLLVITAPLFAAAIFIAASENNAVVGGLGVVASLIGLVFLGVVQASYLVREGQTIGKKLMKIRIVDQEDGQVPHWTRVLAMRYLLNAVLRQIPLYGLVDVLFIFGNEQRCVHDHLARTKVVEV